MAQQVQIQRKLRTKPSNDKCSSIEMVNSTEKNEIFWLSYVRVTMCESMIFLNTLPLLEFLRVNESFW